MKKKGILVYNPIAHGGRTGSKVLTHTQKLYAEAGCELVIHSIDPRGCGFGNLAEIVNHEKPDHLLLAGGDGSINRYINYADANGITLPVGIIPAGTANDFARAAGITTDIEGAIKQILYGSPKPVDVAEAISDNGNSTFFINVFSSGYLTCVSHTTPDRLKQHLGKLAYFIHGIIESLSPHRIEFKIETNRGVFKGKALIVLVLNGNTAGGMTFAKTADVTDGMLDVCVIMGSSIPKIFTTALKVMMRTDLYDSDDVFYIKASEISIVDLDRTNFETDVDGDPGPAYPIKIRCRSNMLNIIV